MNSNFIHLDGELISEDKTNLPATGRGIAYGDGCFTTLRSYQGRFLHFDDHVERLKAGAEYLFMNTELDVSSLREKALALLEANNLMEVDAKVRIQLTRKGDGGFSELSSEFHLIITVSKSSAIVEPVSLGTVSTKSIPSESLSRSVKLSNSINYIRAMQQARQKGFDDALMTTISGNISETSISNIFWINGQTVFTPSRECDLLPGVMRNIIVDLVNKSEDIHLKTGAFALDDVYNAEAIFCTNAFREVYPVSSLNDKSFDISNSTFLQIKSLLKACKKNHLK